METMVSVWAMMEHVRVASGAAELAIFTAILYWFFTSSRVADMLEVVGERVGGWCGRDTSSSLRQAMRARRRPHQNDVYAKLDADVATRTASLYRVKEEPVVPAPQPQTRPPAGLACARCAPLSRESWRDPNEVDTGAVINILDIGRQNFANGGVVSRYLCDLAQCINLTKYDFKDVAPSVEKDESFRRAIEETTQEELRKCNGSLAGSGDGAAAEYATVRAKVEARAKRVLRDISSAMSHKVLRLVAWLCHKAVRRVAGGGCGTRAASAARLRRASAAGLPLVFVPLHRSHFDYILVTFALYLTGLRPPLVAAGDNMRIPFFGWFLRGCGAFYIKRRVEGSEAQCDPVYKSALRSYILNSLGANNNLEFFIEGGRTRTGKPQHPKAGILSVIMDAYLDGTIDDALLVPVTLNYDRLVDGNFVREQLGMPKQMETFWSALRGIWRTLNTNHGGIRVDFNQPISLKELVTSFQKSQSFRNSLEANNNLGPERRILYNNSQSSLYGDGVSDEHKLMVDAIGRHLVYDAAQATALMCTNVVSYVMLTEKRAGASVGSLRAAVRARGEALARAGRDLAYSAGDHVLLKHALGMLGRTLVRREGSGETARVRPQPGVGAALELAYYASAVAAHYAPQALLATALESVVVESGSAVVRHEQLVGAALRLAAVLGAEFILCAPCTSLEECVLDALDTLLADNVLATQLAAPGLEEEQWSRRLARRLEEEEDAEAPPACNTIYYVSNTPEALAERRRLILTIRPLLEAYSTTCRCLSNGSQKAVVKHTLDTLTEDFTQNKMIYGEAVSTDAIRNCLRLLRQWGIIEMYTEQRERCLRICPQYEDPAALQEACADIHRFNVNSPLLQQ